jgi:hypothetical protein
MIKKYEPKFEESVYKMKEASAKDLVDFAINTYSFVLNTPKYSKEKEISFSDWADEIARNYDISEPRNKQIYQVLKDFPNFILVRKGPRWNKVTYKKG